MCGDASRPRDLDEAHGVRRVAGADDEQQSDLVEQVASLDVSPRASAASRTAGATPCAENTTVEPSGISSTESTKTAPRSSSSRTTCELWTICLRTYTGFP